ncbi:M28 family peptidase [Bacillus sp. GM2]|jgi:aminopeptidase YwaD|uniref:Aminopeptidase n=2 Tax=Bacillus licheniformis TaxID=1402 RepID=Q65DH7_BACLD|nr:MULTISPECIES: M28 family peptidase [Bacillus]MBY8348434.1 M28 family peptidase [Bacillus sp. PCH94]MDP4079927.1 M28 family peptidase [Bacillota bacterium]AAU25515.1 aminopeptidase [Bacillus licheniformis DSM 13 = ATCC 14580]AAU42887.1 double-zinc aminopeptidase YwaD [Bacillus licheniformis DSM 13 = ATCC 14580]AKQ75352.1 aminopeptidase [Bacillus licheniformis WX-02]
MKRKMMMFGLALSIIAGGVVADGTGNAAQAAPQETAIAKDIEKFSKKFNENRAYQTIYHLSETIGPRVTGTAEEKKSAAFIASQMKKSNLKVSTQKFSIPDRLEGTLTVQGNNVPARPAAGSAPTAAEGLAAPLYDAGLGLPGDFTEEAKGKIAVILRGELTFYEKAKNAADAGASGVIIYNNVDSLVPLTPNLSGNKVDIPVVGVKKEDGEKLLSEQEAILKLKAHKNQTSQNVIGVRKAKGVKNPDIVYVTSHYDSVPYAPGANDNASGTSVVLELARILKTVPADKEIRFITFGAEEIGLLGSRHYVSTLSNQEVKRSVANFNLDMVATSWENASQLYINTPDGSANLVWQLSKAASLSLGKDVLFLHQGGSSDHVPFHEAGIDSANFIWREPGTGALEPWYHTPYDTIEHISKDRLKTAGQIAGTAVYNFTKKENRKPSYSSVAQ